MSHEPARIRVKAMLIAPNADRSAHVVSVCPPSAENPNGYHRLIGGSVEFGETHRAAIIREVREEIDAAIDDLVLVDVVENIFTQEGLPGHEVVFVYTGRLRPEPALDGAVLVESDGSELPLVWRSVEDTAEALPLYPAGSSDLARR